MLCSTQAKKEVAELVFGDIHVRRHVFVFVLIVVVVFNIVYVFASVAVVVVVIVVCHCCCFYHHGRSNATKVSQLNRKLNQPRSYYSLCRINLQLF